MGIKYCHAMGEILYPMIKCCPDILAHVILLSQYMANPGEPHFLALINKREQRKTPSHRVSNKKSKLGKKKKRGLQYYDLIPQANIDGFSQRPFSECAHAHFFYNLPTCMLVS
jgi:hypothetical protein